MTRVAAFGLSVDVPPRWHARAFRHGAGDPTLHLASFPLPAGDGEFGSLATGSMPRTGLFLALTEYRLPAEAVGKGLFAGAQPRRIEGALLSGNALLRQLPGQRGGQRFFSSAGRAFCLYVVAAGDDAALFRDADAALASLVVRPQPATVARTTTRP